MTLECPNCRSLNEVGGRPAGTRVRCPCGTVQTVPAPTEALGAIVCPHCGAAASLDDASCRYCRMPLSLAACPRCFGRVFVGNAYCPHCGAKIEVPAVAGKEGASQRLCPRCAPVTNQLVAHLIGQTLLDECQHCGGLWIDMHAFERVVDDKEQQATLLAVGIGEGVGTQTGGVGAAASRVAIPPVRYLHCPDCNVLMNRKNFGERSGVIIEICRSHGIWFDRDELSAALRFVAAGGLEETKRLKVEALDDRLQHLTIREPDLFAADDSFRQITWPNLSSVGSGVVGVLRSLLKQT
jgi:Zn-finger nucleic acid-binding protein